MSSVQGVFFATAMAAVSGTAVLLLALKLQRSIPQTSAQISSVTEVDSEVNSSTVSDLRPCISYGRMKKDDENKQKKKKKKKKVSFAKDVVDPAGNGEEFRRRLNLASRSSSSNKSGSSSNRRSTPGVVREGRMPANRMALYNGILRDRFSHRMTCIY